MKTYVQTLFYIPLCIIILSAGFMQSCSDDDDEGPLPVAAFSHTSDNNFQAPSTITFTNASEHVDTYEWDFGDGSAASTTANPVHTYNDPGTYTVSLTVRNGRGSDTETKTLQITAEQNAPIAEFSFTSDNEFRAPSEVSFTNSSQNATSYSWNFGDGSDPSTEENPVHTYNAAGTYTVTLTASNGSAESEKTVTVTISEMAAPEANFTFTSDNEFISPSTITFTNTSTNATSYSWDFGDGSDASDEESPVHIYTTPGTYTVTLTATGGDESQTKTETIEIFAPAFTGMYKLSSAMLTADLVVEDVGSYPDGTDVTDTALGLFNVVSCSGASNIGMDLRPDGTIYFMCLDAGAAAAVQGGTWSSNSTDNSISLNFTTPPYPMDFEITLMNAEITANTMTAELVNQDIEGSLIGLPVEGTVPVSAEIYFELVSMPE